MLLLVVWKMLSQMDWKPMGYVAAFQSMLARVSTTDDYTEKTLYLDLWRFIVNPYNLAAAVRGKLMETIMTEIRLALGRCSSGDNSNLADLLEFLATAVYSLHALLLYNDRECDTESINEETRWPANVGLKTLASIGQIVTHTTVKEYIASYPLHPQVLNLQSAVAAFLARLSWNNDNKGTTHTTILTTHISIVVSDNKNKMLLPCVYVRVAGLRLSVFSRSPALSNHGRRSVASDLEVGIGRGHLKPTENDRPTTIDCFRSAGVKKRPASDDSLFNAGALRNDNVEYLKSLRQRHPSGVGSKDVLDGFPNGSTHRRKACCASQNLVVCPKLGQRTQHAAFYARATASSRLAIDHWNQCSIVRTAALT